MLMEALEKNDEDRFAEVLEQMTDSSVCQLLYAVDRFGYNLIHLCTYFNRLEILKLLIQTFKESLERMITS
jgi:hypothetical protein